MLPVSLVAAVAMLSPSAGDGRSYVSGYFALNLDNVKCGWVSEVDGGHAVADVVTEKVNGTSKKHIANVKWSEISIRSGSGMEPPFYKWIKASFDKKYERRSGEVMCGDFKRTGSGVVFENAIITELGMPALDAASKDAAKMTLNVQPSFAEWLPAVQRTDAPKKKELDNWRSSSFRCMLDGIGNACERIEPMNFAFGTEVGADGTASPVIDIDDITLTFPGTSGEALHTWWIQLLANPDSSDKLERRMVIQTLNGDGLMTFEFTGVGIKSIAPERGENGTETRRIKAEMYCEDVRFSYAASATFG